MGGAVAAVALSREPILTAAALVVAGGMWMMAVAVFNIGVQLSAPRWVAGRSLAAYQAAISGGIAIGSWGWGHLTDAAGVEAALLVSAVLMLLSPLLGLRLRMPRISARGEDAEVLADPEVRLPLTGRSGPLVVEIEYRVAPENARAFHNVMQDVQLSRQRNGAYGWSVARDIADPELWTERYHCPTWLDYLRQRNRPTQSERSLHQQAMDFHIGAEPVRIRRMLERPFGSVRGKEDPPERGANEVLPVIASRRQQHVKRNELWSKRRRALARSRRHCPCSAISRSQPRLMRERCCCRQDSTAWSPLFMTARQSRATSRAQASCSRAVCADAPEAISRKAIKHVNLVIGPRPNLSPTSFVGRERPSRNAFGGKWRRRRSVSPHRLKSSECA
jgi:hypothetical protein